MQKVRNVWIGLAIDAPLNDKAKSFLKKLVLVLKIFTKASVFVLTPARFIERIENTKVLPYSDDNKLFDFSRYARIISFEEIHDDEILFCFNDTFANGRKANTGLFIFVLLSFLILTNIKSTPRKLWAPVDRDKFSSWVCPYFFVGRVGFLRALNFSDWQSARFKVEKTIRRQLTRWLQHGWRRSKTASSQHVRIKYKTLVLERALLSSAEIKKNVSSFSRSNFLRIINSINL